MDNCSTILGAPPDSGRHPVYCTNQSTLLLRSTRSSCRISDCVLLDHPCSSDRNLIWKPINNVFSPLDKQAEVEHWRGSGNSSLTQPECRPCTKAGPFSCRPLASSPISSRVSKSSTSSDLKKTLSNIWLQYSGRKAGTRNLSQPGW